jgi:hypothetical protein
MITVLEMSSLQVTKTTYSGLQEHRIMKYTATGHKAKAKECSNVLILCFHVFSAALLVLLHALLLLPHQYNDHT